MKEDKKNIIIIVVAVIVVLLVLLFLYKYSANKQSAVPTSSNVANNAKQDGIDIEDLVKSVKDEYKNMPKFRQCVASDMSINRCLEEIVRERVEKTGKVEYCQDLNRKDLVDGCVAYFKAQKALKSGDESDCAGAPNQESCVSQVRSEKAINTGALEECNKISIPGSRGACRHRVVSKNALAKDSLKECEKLNEEGEERLMKICKKDVLDARQQRKAQAEAQAAAKKAQAEAQAQTNETEQKQAEQQ